MNRPTRGIYGMIRKCFYLTLVIHSITSPAFSMTTQEKNIRYFQDRIRNKEQPIAEEKVSAHQKQHHPPPLSSTEEKSMPGCQDHPEKPLCCQPDRYGLCCPHGTQPIIISCCCQHSEKSSWSFVNLNTVITTIAMVSLLVILSKINFDLSLFLPSFSVKFLPSFLHRPSPSDETSDKQNSGSETKKKFSNADISKKSESPTQTIKTKERTDKKTSEEGGNSVDITQYASMINFLYEVLFEEKDQEIRGEG